MNDTTERDALARVLWEQDESRGTVPGAWVPYTRGTQIWKHTPFEMLPAPNRWIADAEVLISLGYRAEREPVVVDDAMVERALEAFVGGPFDFPGSRPHWEPRMRAALLAALISDAQDADA